MKYCALILSSLLWTGSLWAGESVTIRTQAEWEKAVADSKGVAIKDGTVAPTGKAGQIRTHLQKFDRKQSAKRLILTQSAVWQNWNPIENLGPANLNDAPVLLTVGPDNYWMFGRYGSRRGGAFKAEKATLRGFDMPLLTTRYPNQFDASGGLKPGKGGYHAWQSRDIRGYFKQISEKLSPRFSTDHLSFAAHKSAAQAHFGLLASARL